MTFSLSKEEGELLTKAECEFMNWCRSEDEFAKVLVLPPLRKSRGSPGNPRGRVWVLIAARHWLDPKRFTSTVIPIHWPAPENEVRIASREPAAEDGRFPEAVITFGLGKSHLPIVGVELIEAVIKQWRKVGLPGTRAEPHPDWPPFSELPPVTELG